MIQKFFVVGALALSLSACASSSSSYDQAAVSPDATASLCQDLGHEASVLTAERIVQTKPIYEDMEYMSRSRLQQTKGVEMLVVAQPGDSEAYLERAIRCEAAFRAGMDDLHPLAVEGVDVEVESRGPYFAVRLKGNTVGQGRELAQRAEHYRG